MAEIRDNTAKDAELSALRRAWRDDSWSSYIATYQKFRDELSEVDGIVLRHNRLGVPTTLQQAVFRLTHEGHPGVSKMKARLRTKVCWHEMDGQAALYVKKCHGCQMLSIPNNPVSLVITELPIGSPSGENILIIVDDYSRFLMVEPMHKITTQKTMLVLQSLFMRFGRYVGRR